MKILLDTHFVLWALLDPSRLPERGRELIEDRQNEIVFSAANLWEIAVKRAVGKKDFKADASVLREAMLASDYTELPILGTQALAVGR